MNTLFTTSLTKAQSFLKRINTHVALVGINNEESNEVVLEEVAHVDMPQNLKAERGGVGTSGFIKCLGTMGLTQIDSKIVGSWRVVSFNTPFGFSFEVRISCS